MQTAQPVSPGSHIHPGPSYSLHSHTQGMLWDCLQASVEPKFKLRSSISRSPPSNNQHAIDSTLTQHPNPSFPPFSSTISGWSISLSPAHVSQQPNGQKATPRESSEHSSSTPLPQIFPDSRAEAPDAHSSQKTAPQSPMLENTMTSNEWRTQWKSGSWNQLPNSRTRLKWHSFGAADKNLAHISLIVSLHKG